MNDNLTVGELAKRVGVTPKTVRYYEEIGLLPSARRGANGYRYFGLDELNRLQFIQRAKALGLSLGEIRILATIAGAGCCAETRAELAQILDGKITECTRRIETLVSFREQMKAAARHLYEAPGDEGGACCPAGCATFEPTCRCIPEF